MKKTLAVLVLIIALIAGCGGEKQGEQKLLSFENDVAYITKEDVLKIESGMTFKEVLELLGPTQDIGSGLYVALYRVDDTEKLLISASRFDEAIKSTGEQLMETLVSVVSIRGTVTELSQLSDGISMRVEANDPQQGKYDIAVVRADKNTRVKDANGNALTLGDIATGDEVEAVFSGPVAESYPVQAYAEFIRVHK